MSDDRLRMVLSFAFGFALLGSITGLALVLALGTVVEQTSAGLKEILACLMTLAGVWANSVLGALRSASSPTAATPQEQ